MHLLLHLAQQNCSSTNLASILKYAHLLHVNLYYFFNGIATLSCEISIPLFLSF